MRRMVRQAGLPDPARARITVKIGLCECNPFLDQTTRLGYKVSVAAAFSEWVRIILVRQQRLFVIP